MLRSSSDIILVIIVLFIRYVRTNISTSIKHYIDDNESD